MSHASVLCAGLYKRIQMVIPFGQLPLHRRILLNHANFVAEEWLDMTLRAVNS